MPRCSSLRWVGSKLEPWREDGSARSRYRPSGSGATTSACAATRRTTAAVVNAAIDAGVTLFDTADVYGGMAGPRSSSAGPSAPAGTKCSSPPSSACRWAAMASRARSRALDRAGGRGQPAPPRDRPHRPLPAPRPGRRHAHRGDARRARRAGAGRQGPGDRQLQLRRRADPRRPKRPRAAGAARFVERAELLQPAEPRAGAATSLRPRASAWDWRVLPYFPLANGLLTGKYRRGEAPPDGTRLAGLPSDGPTAS